MKLSDIPAVEDVKPVTTTHHGIEVVHRTTVDKAYRAYIQKTQRAQLRGEINVEEQDQYDRVNHEAVYHIIESWNLDDKVTPANVHELLTKVPILYTKIIDNAHEAARLMGKPAEPSNDTPASGTKGSN